MTHDAATSSTRPQKTANIYFSAYDRVTPSRLARGDDHPWVEGATSYRCSDPPWTSV